jgi:1-deoxy-D-xylulose-5-phosphate reductoisomerase
MPRVAILGSTGSIGTNALDVLRRLQDRFSVCALTAQRNVELLRQQAEEFEPQAVVIGDATLASELGSLKANVLVGSEGLEQVATMPEADIVLNALVGAAGLVPTLRALEADKQVALANKESLVLGGELVMETARRCQGSIIPVDSEHSAIHQCLEGHRPESVQRIILTASGGPFVTFSADKLRSVSPQQALSHPVWDMGRKVTIDSATLMNKGLEIIEAHWLFDIPLTRIDVLIHQQSIVHSLVEFSDNVMLAQLSVPDMRLPIQYALTYPQREQSLPASLDLAAVGALTFQRSDPVKFPCLQLARRAAELGGSMPAVLNAANEVAVPAFLKGQVRFTDIPEVIGETMGRHHLVPHPDLIRIQEADSWARRTAEAEILRMTQHRKMDQGAQ